MILKIVIRSLLYLYADSPVGDRRQGEVLRMYRIDPLWSATRDCFEDLGMRDSS